MKNRPARVKELIQRELGALLMREMNFTTLVTVQSVDLTADFKHCHVHVGVLGSQDQQRDVIQALAQRRSQLQHEMAKRVVLKFTPQLHFHLDHTAERGTKIVDILRQIDEITPPDEEGSVGLPPMTPRAAREASDMEAEDREEQAAEQLDAARHQVETDGADDEQDALFDGLIEGEEADATDDDAPTATSADLRDGRHARNAKLRAEYQKDLADE